MESFKMATIKKKQSRYGQYGGFSPYGNVTALIFALATSSTGAVVDSDTTAPVASGDVIDLGELPEGMRLDDAQILIKTGMAATVKGSLGFKYTDGINSTAVPEDAAYFINAGDIATAGRLRANTGKLVTLPKPARLILTTSTAANDKASDIQVIVTGELTGPR